MEQPLDMSPIYIRPNITMVQAAYGGASDSSLLLYDSAIFLLLAMDVPITKHRFSILMPAFTLTTGSAVRLLTDVTRWVSSISKS